jgi:hypothetical protein
MNHPFDFTTDPRQPFASEYADALRAAFPPEVIAAYIEEMPPESRAKLERQFGPLPTTTNPTP